jgi:hypothetical protein
MSTTSSTKRWPTTSIGSTIWSVCGAARAEGIPSPPVRDSLTPHAYPATRLTLETLLAASRSAFDAADHAGARAALLDFESAVRTAAGGAVPDRWRSARDLDNIAGDLLGESASLRFTLGRM